MTVRITSAGATASRLPFCSETVVAVDMLEPVPVPQTTGEREPPGVADMRNFEALRLSRGR